jgi:hypothetical protein
MTGLFLGALGLARAGLAALVMSATAASLPAPADRAYVLEWVAPATCPDADQVEARIDALIQHAAPLPSGLLQVRMSAEERDGDWRLEVVLLGREFVGERVLVGADCTEVAQAAALVVGIALDPEGAWANPSLVPEPEVHEVPEPRPEPPAPLQDLAEPASSSPLDTQAEPTTPRDGNAVRLRWRIRAAGGLGLGAVPRPAGVARVAFGPMGRFWAVELGATAWPFTRISAPSRDDVGADLNLWSVDVRGCGVVPGARLEFAGCLGVLMGAMHGLGVGELEVRYRRAAPWVAVAPGASLRVMLATRWWLHAEAELVTVVARPDFVIDTVGRVCCGGAVGGIFSHPTTATSATSSQIRSSPCTSAARCTATLNAPDADIGCPTMDPDAGPRGRAAGRGQRSLRVPWSDSSSSDFFAMDEARRPTWGPAMGCEASTSKHGGRPGFGASVRWSRLDRRGEGTGTVRPTADCRWPGARCQAQRRLVPPRLGHRLPDRVTPGSSPRASVRARDASAFDRSSVLDAVSRLRRSPVDAAEGELGGVGAQRGSSR